MYDKRDPYYDYGARGQPDYDQYNGQQPRGYDTQYPDSPQYPRNTPPRYHHGYPPYPPPRSGMNLLVPVVIIVVVLAVVLPIVGIFLLTSNDSGNTSSNGYNGNGSTGNSISATTSDKNIYYQIDIVKTSGGTLNIADAKFLLITAAGTQLVERRYTDANPASVSQGDTIVYPIPSSFQVTLNGTNDPIENSDIPNPQLWENCYFAYLDSESDRKVNSGDAIWIYKDYNDDGRNEITSGYRFRIRDVDGNDVLIKEL